LKTRLPDKEIGVTLSPLASKRLRTNMRDKNDFQLKLTGVAGRGGAAGALWGHSRGTIWAQRGRSGGAAGAQPGHSRGAAGLEPKKTRTVKTTHTRSQLLQFRFQHSIPRGTILKLDSKN